MGSSASGTLAASPACREHNRTNWSIVLQDIYQPPNLLQNSKCGPLSLGRKLRKPHSRARTKHGRQERKEKKGGGGQRGGRLEIGKCAPGQERAFSGLASPRSSTLPASLGCQRGIFHLGDPSSDAFGTFTADAVPRTAVSYRCPLGRGSPWERAPPGGPGPGFRLGEREPMLRARGPRHGQHSGHLAKPCPQHWAAPATALTQRFFPKSCRNKTKPIKVPLKRSSFSRGRRRLLAGVRGAERGPSFYSFLIFSGSL